ncbi:MAG: hypothetical protein WBP75_10580 [Candidatus Cybelea sp.]
MQTGIASEYKGLRDLYVSDGGAFAGKPGARIDILKNKTYEYDGYITGKKSGIVTPIGNFLDDPGNLYVADQDAVNIKEYALGATSPTFTYNASMNSPEDVSVDRAGNVYEADYRRPGSFVNEYAQESNKVIHTCSTGNGAISIAVDQKGDVFVDTLTQILEYKGGLVGCYATVLGVSFPNSGGGGMALDNHDDIIVTVTGYNGTGYGATVDIIAPPYKSVTRTLGEGDYATPQSVRISKKNRLVFVSDIGFPAEGSPGHVFVFSYPAGALVATLGGAYGVITPYCAVDGPNSVY